MSGEKGQLIKFEDEYATLFETGEEKANQQPKCRVSVSDLMKECEKNQEETSVKTPVLPSGTIYYAKSGKDELVAIEQKPCVRSIRWSNMDLGSYDPRFDKKLNLAFPFVILAFHFYGQRLYEASCYYRNSPVNSLDDELCQSNLQNVSSGKNTFCLHPLMSMDGSSLIEQIDNLISEIWDGTFTANIIYSAFRISTQIDSRISTVEAWAKHSEINPSFVLEIPWKKTGMNIRKMKEWFVSGRRAGQKENLFENTQQLADIMYRLKEVE
jgi:hypothetical protein